MASLENDNIALVFLDFDKAGLRAFRFAIQRHVGSQHLLGVSVPTLYVSSGDAIGYITNLFDVLVFGIRNVQRKLVAFALRIDRKHLPCALLVLVFLRGRIYILKKERELTLLSFMELLDIAVPWRIKIFFAKSKGFILASLFGFIVGNWLKMAGKKHDE